MTSDRQRALIERLLSEAEDAVVAGQWDLVARHAQSVLAFESTHPDALAFRDAAEWITAKPAAVDPSPGPSPSPPIHPQGRSDPATLAGRLEVATPQARAWFTAKAARDAEFAAARDADLAAANAAAKAKAKADREADAPASAAARAAARAALAAARAAANAKAAAKAEAEADLEADAPARAVRASEWANQVSATAPPPPNGMQGWRKRSF